MLELIQAIPFAFGALFPVVNPIGSSVIFLSLVSGSSKQELHKLSLKISIYVTVMLIIVLLVGSWILRLFGITIPIVLIGGGFVLAYIGWQLLAKPDTPPGDKMTSEDIDEDTDLMAFYPLTMPVTAGPGCIAVAIAIGAHGISNNSWERSVMSLTGSAIGIILIGLSVFLCYYYAYAITSKLGKAGTQVIIRLAAFINLCIGLELVWHGIRYLLPAS